MRALPEEFDAGALITSLADGWSFDASTIDYSPIGFGSYHWVVTDSAGTRAFVTVDDLDRKPWLGDTRDEAFDGLRRSFETAVALRDAGLGFVVAPILGSNGEAVRRVGPRYSIALFPFVDGEARQFGEYETPEDRIAVAGLLARLHRATPAVESIARRIDLRLAGRNDLEAALREIDRPWSGGPYTEPARQALASHAADVAELLGLLDRLARDVASRASLWVVTHGEPHAANVIRTDVGPALVDWDTVALAPPERDLWMLAGHSGEELAAYVDETGHQPDDVAIDFFRLGWDLADLASFTDVLRSAHEDSHDTALAFNGLRKCAAIRDQWAARLD